MFNRKKKEKSFVSPRIGTHGPCNGAGLFLQAVTDEGIPSIFKAVDNGGWAAECATISKASGVNHTVLFRQTAPGGLADDHFDLSLSPKEAAQKLWWACLKTMPPEVARLRDSIYIEPTNEPGLMNVGEPGQVERYQWINEACMEIASIMLTDGYKPALAGFNAGTPHPPHWLYFLPLLNLLQQNDGLLTWHEAKLPGAWSKYQGHEEPIELFVPYVIGSARRHQEEWKKLGMTAFPKAVISESAWGYRELASDSRFRMDVDWMARDDAKYSWLRGRLLWNCVKGEQWPKLPQQLTAQMDWLKDYTLNTKIEIDNETKCSGQPRVDYKRTYHVLPQNVTDERFVEVALQAKASGLQTVGFSYDDAGIGDLSSKKAILYDIPDNERERYSAWYAEHYPAVVVEFKNAAPPRNPLDGLQFGRLFNEKYVLTSSFDAPRSYGKHEGTDYDITIAEADSKRPVLAPYPGTVVRAQNTTTSGKPSDYGWHVRVECVNNGSVFYYWLAHMDRLYVKVGDVLAMGDEVGELGGSGIGGSGRFAEHVHVNLEVPGYGLAGYVVADVVDPAPYIPVDSKPDDGYHGPDVGQFISGLDQPASDWRWSQVGYVFTGSGLWPKFHTVGDSWKYYSQYKHGEFNPVRIRPSGDFSSKEAIDFYFETIGGVRNFWNLGARDFIVLNEPNIEHVGSWSNGYEFGLLFVDLCKLYKSQMPGIRLWFPGCSPQFGAQHGFIADAKKAGAFNHVVGIVEHVYTGITDNEEAAIAQMIGEVLDFQRRWSLDRPLVIGEFSVNRPADSSYKARVYKETYNKFKSIKGLKAAYCFTADWEPSADSNKEGWIKNGIYDAWLK